MPKPSSEQRAELVAFLDQDKTRLGEVFRLTGQGLNHQQIAAELGLANSGFVSNYRSSARALLDGEAMKSPSMAEQTAARVRTLLKSQTFTEDTRSYLLALMDELETAAGNVSKIVKPPSGAKTIGLAGVDLRSAVDDVLRTRAEELIDRIKEHAALDADDYYRLVTARRPLDQLVDLIDRQTPSATSLALFQQKHHELTIEQALIDWSADLPLTSSLVESARGRVQYWLHE